MDIATALWIVVPLALVHWCARRRRALLLFQVAVDVMLLLLPGRLLLQGLHIGPGVPGSPEWGGPVSVTGSQEQSDLPLQLAVWWEEVRRLTAAGEPPWISDRIGGGTPLFGNGQTQLPFPLNVPVWVLGAERGTDVMSVWKLEIVALGGFFLLRRLRLVPAAAAAGALGGAFGLFSLSWLVSPVTWVTAAAPWAWWLLIATLRGSRRSAGALALLMGILAGWSVNPESAAFLWLALGMGGVVLGFGRWRRLGRLAVPFVLALAVAGVGALPTVATILDSPKLAQATGAHNYPSPDIGWGLRGRVAALLLTPRRDGNPADGTWIHAFPAAPVSLAVGCVAVACVLAGRPRRRLRRAVVAFAAVGLLGAGMLLQLPGLAHVLARVPVLGIMVWTRAAFLIPFAIAMLAGVGADAIIRNRRRWRFATAAAVLQIAVLILALTAPSGRCERSTLRVGWFPALAVLLAPTVPAGGGVAIPALVLAESWTLGRGLLPGSKEPPLKAPPRAVAELRSLVANEGGRILGLGSAFAPNLAARLGFSDLRSFSPVRPLALARLHQALGAAGMDLPGPVTTPWAGLAGAWCVRWLATPPEGVTGPAAAGWQEAYRDAGGRLYRNVRALPVLRLATRSVPSPGDPSAGAWEGVDFASTAVAESPVPVAGEGTLRVVDDRPWRHEAQAEVRGTVLAVLHVPYAPGWACFLDSRPVAAVDADLGAMAIVVPAGEHALLWVYSPPMLVPGLLLTFAGLFGAVAVAVRSPRRRR